MTTSSLDRAPHSALEMAPRPAEPAFDVSVVMPCLNEAETLTRCIQKAQSAFQTLQLRGEVIVADNGSTDGSVEIALRMGARVVHVSQKGYGSALRGGIEAARAPWIVMGDSDDSYDFSDLSPFIASLRNGKDLVMGNRFQGQIRPGAMPWTHRFLGNPVLTMIGRILFGCPVGDFHCGLRAFTKEAYRKMDLRTSGMEFASEMVIKSTLLRLPIAEVPVVLSKDGRSRPPHLRTWRDGWRHLRFMLLFSPLWLFLIPGLGLLTSGLALATWLLPGPRRLGSVEFDIHTLLVAWAMAGVGIQLLVFGIFSKALAVQQGIHPPSRLLRWVRHRWALEAGILGGALIVLSGLGLLVAAVRAWHGASFGPLEPQVGMRRVIPAMGLITLGVETFFASFFLSILGLFEKPSPRTSEALLPPTPGK